MPVGKDVLFNDDECFGFSETIKNKIQPFLEQIGSWLAEYRLQNGDLFSSFLNDLCKKNNMNQMFILSLMQKEQSLVQKQVIPSKHKLDWAVGYGCPESGGRNSRYQGFENQLKFATKQFIRYLSWKRIIEYKTTKIKLFDSQKTLDQYGVEKYIIASTKAEACAFLYNPRISGITLHSEIYHKYMDIIEPFCVD